ncbi:MAG: outer membrane protein assembly factor BamA, partial [Spirochaetales bacterium]
TERPVVDEIRVTGNTNVRKADILDVVLLKNGDMVNKTKVQLDSDAVKELYLERGFPDVVVTGDVEYSEDKSTAVVVFDVVEGSQTKIREIRFSGNSFASNGTLKRLMTTKVQALFASGVFQESKFQEDILKIETYYRDHGYVDALVANVVKDTEKDEKDLSRNYLIITIYINEGEQFSFSGYTFDGNTLFTDQQLLDVTRQRPDTILNKSRSDADYMRITDVYFNDGYIYNVITKEENRDTETNSIGYNINITERMRAHIENILISGNEKTKDYILFRELPFEVGDIFSKEKIQQGLMNLYNLQFFSSVVPETPMGSADGLMDLIINVEEGKTIDVNFGVTFSGSAGDFPVMGFLKWSDKNFLGRGLMVSAGTELSPTKQTVNIGYSQNWIGSQRMSFGLDFSFQHELTRSIQQDMLGPVFPAGASNAVPDPYQGYYVFSGDTVYPAETGSTYLAGTPFPGIPSEADIADYGLITDYAWALKNKIYIPDSYLMEYNSYQLSLGISTGYQWFTRVGRLGVSTGFTPAVTFITYDPEVYRPFNATVRDNLDQWQWINKLWLSLSWDKRDYIYNPTTGFYINQAFTYTGGFLGGTRDYIKSASKAEAFIKLVDEPVFENWNFKMVFAIHSNISLLLKQYFRQQDGLWGWGNSLTPNDLLFTDGMLTARGWPSVSGMALWNNWVELRIPILEQYLWWDFFFSATSVWDNLEAISTTTIDNFMFSFGGGLRLTIPGLPIGFYLTKRFKVENGAVQWQNGNMFNPDNVPGGGIDFVVSFTYEIF